MALSTTNFYPLPPLTPKSPFLSFTRPGPVEPSHWFLCWMVQMTCFRPGTVLLGIWTMSDVIWGKCAQKGEWIGSFKPKSIHRNISGTINPTNKRFEDRVQTTTGTSWVVCHYLQSKYNMADGRRLENRYDIILPRWVVRFGRNSAAWCSPITAKWLRSKPEVEFQYGGRLFFQTGSSNISAVNWSVDKIWFAGRFWPSESSDINKYETGNSIERPRLPSWKKSIWRHISAMGGPI